MSCFIRSSLPLQFVVRTDMYNVGRLLLTALQTSLIVILFHRIMPRGPRVFVSAWIDEVALGVNT